MRRLRAIACAMLPLVALMMPAQAGPGAPPGWTGSATKAGDYEYGTDARAGTAGKQAAYVKARPNAVLNGFGSIAQCIRAEKYIGQRLRLSARLQAVEAIRAQLWMRVDGASSKVLSFYNMVDRPLIGTTGWEQEHIVLDVPAGSAIVCYGFFLAGGKGEVWADGLSLGTVGSDVPVSRMPPLQPAPTAPVNLGFDR